jgi:hemerythrin-like domain-containing protein
MQSILEYMRKEHEKCDGHFAQAEQDVASIQWQAADKSFANFASEIERHFNIEEQMLFPSVERSMGGGGGPIAVMRMEHSQMRGLIQSMTELLSAQDRDGFLGASETLLILMQQHNMKEEQIVYPMTDRIMSADTEHVLAEIERF